MDKVTALSDDTYSPEAVKLNTIHLLQAHNRPPNVFYTSVPPYLSLNGNLSNLNYHDYHSGYEHRDKFNTQYELVSQKYYISSVRAGI